MPSSPTNDCSHRQRRTGRQVWSLCRVALLVAALAGGPLAGGRQGAAAQSAPVDQSGISVTGNGVATTPAATAAIQFVISSGPAPVAVPTDATAPTAAAETPTATATPVADGRATPEPTVSLPTRLSAPDLDPVVQVLVAGGVAAENVKITISPAYLDRIQAPFARVEALVFQPTLETVTALIQAATNAADAGGFFVADVGVGYGASDCAALKRQARQAAIQDAKDQAAQLADLLGVSLGKLLFVSEYSVDPRPLPGGGCAPAAGTATGTQAPNLTLTPFDPTAPAAAMVMSSIYMGYAIA